MIRSSIVISDITIILACPKIIPLLTTEEGIRKSNNLSAYKLPYSRHYHDNSLKAVVWIFQDKPFTVPTYKLHNQ